AGAETDAVVYAVGVLVAVAPVVAMVGVAEAVALEGRVRFLTTKVVAAILEAVPVAVVIRNASEAVCDVAPCRWRWGCWAALVHVATAGGTTIGRFIACLVALTEFGAVEISIATPREPPVGVFIGLVSLEVERAALACGDLAFAGTEAVAVLVRDAGQ